MSDDTDIPTNTTLVSDAQLAVEVARLRDEAQVDPVTSFRDAYAELSALVSELESDAADVDELAAKVARATALAEHCQRKVTTTRMVFDVLDPAPQGGTASSRGRDGTDRLPA